jgi:hypothetical protein
MSKYLVVEEIATLHALDNRTFGELRRSMHKCFVLFYVERFASSYFYDIDT